MSAHSSRDTCGPTHALAKVLGKQVQPGGRDTEAKSFGSSCMLVCVLATELQELVPVPSPKR